MRTNTRPKRIVLAVGLALLASVTTACNRSPLCRGGECAEDNGEEGNGDGDVQPDIGAAESGTDDGACGGADLQTDDRNCGECGNSCDDEEKFGHDAGHCAAGECSPTWTDCDKESYAGPNCDTRCAKQQKTCVPQGCAGYTALFLTGASDSASGCHADNVEPLATPCDAPLPWSADPITERVICCCTPDE
jgi:hypothetical protein